MSPYDALIYELDCALSELHAARNCAIAGDGLATTVALLRAQGSCSLAHELNDELRFASEFGRVRAPA